uniref:Signal recognition particle subunit SRP68 n=1 Tax=Panagrolaimus superbus TaxID=310955 RepID=A0A914Z423_9BILA
MNCYRFFEILIFEVERAWAYAMQLKYECNDDELSRKKFHKMNKLRRALEHALHLEQIAKTHPRVDSTTKLEVQAYCAYIGATLGVESKQWKSAEELYKKGIAIYEKLTDVVDSEEMVALYEAR